MEAAQYYAATMGADVLVALASRLFRLRPNAPTETNAPITTPDVDSTSSVMEAVAHLEENLTRVVEMKSPKRQAIVEHYAAVRHI